jgi:hypothetical protein
MDCSDIVMWCLVNVLPRQALGEDWEDWIQEAVCEYLESGTPVTLGRILTGLHPNSGPIRMVQFKST